jgi:hypothetical protein
MSFPSAFPPSDIRELAEANEFYRMTKAEYIERGELLTLALFDCALQPLHGAFDKVKRLVNFYATGQLSISLMHSDILGLCLQAGDECGLSNWPLKVFRHEFYLLLGGLSTQQRDEAIFYHDTWRKNCIPLPRSPPQEQEQEQEPTTPQASVPEAPPSIKAERAAAVATHHTETEQQGIFWDAELYRQRLAAQEPAVSGAQISDLNIQLLCRPCHEPTRSRPCYNNLTWPSPLPRLVALEAGLTTNKRCKHNDAIALIAKRMKCSPDDFYEMSRKEVLARLFNRDHYWAPGWSTGVLKLLTQTSRYW